MLKYGLPFSASFLEARRPTYATTPSSCFAINLLATLTAVRPASKRVSSSSSSSFSGFTPARRSWSTKRAILSASISSLVFELIYSVKLVPTSSWEPSMTSSTLYSSLIVSASPARFFSHLAVLRATLKSPSCVIFAPPLAVYSLAASSRCFMIFCIMDIVSFLWLSP